MVDWVQRTNASKASFRKGNSKFMWEWSREINYKEETEKRGEKEAPVTQALVFLTENITQKSLGFNLLIIETSGNAREKERKGRSGKGGREEEEKEVRGVKEGRNKEPASRERSEGLLQSESTLQRMHFSQGKFDFSMWRNNVICVCGEWKPTLYKDITPCSMLLQLLSWPASLVGLEQSPHSKQERLLFQNTPGKL